MSYEQVCLKERDLCSSQRKNMKNKKAKAVMSSLVFLSASIQGQAEQLEYSSIGTGEEMRSEALADSNAQLPPGQLKADSGSCGKSNQSKCSGGSCSDDSDDTSGGKSKSGKCSGGSCGDDSDAEKNKKIKQGKCSGGSCGES